MSGLVRVDDTSEPLRPNEPLIFLALLVGDGLETFNCLPKPEQERLLGWVGKASDEASRQRRTDVLVIGMRMASLVAS